MEKLMNTIYCTADAIGIETGGGLVTGKEAAALKAISNECKIFAKSGGDVNVVPMGDDPWHYDNGMGFTHHPLGLSLPKDTKLAHFYSGTFSRYIKTLKECGIRTSYTAAAHSVEVSRKEHEKLGFPFPYEHLTNPDLWRDYVAGYRDADLIICPSEHSKQCMESYGCTNVVVIPHGVDMPDENKIKRLPGTFTLGYLGSCSSPDKGVIYLIKAWGQLGYRDAVLVLAGRDSTSPYVKQLIEQYGGNSSIITTGWVKNTADFYNSISCYVQPSVTEGYGIEVNEAMAMGRPVICSTGAGAADRVDVTLGNTQFEPCDVEGLKIRIDAMKKSMQYLPDIGKENREEIKNYTWDKVQQQYQEIWKGLVA